MDHFPIPTAKAFAGQAHGHRQSPATAIAIPLWEQLCAAFVLIMLTGALIGPVLAPDQGESPILRLFWIPSYAITAGLCLLRWRDLLRAWPAIVIVGGAILLAYASLYWSIDPATTQRRVIALAVNSAFAIYLGARYRAVALPRFLALSCLWMGVLSVAFVVALPNIGIHHDVNAGLWRGIWYEKNQMGLVMVAGAISAAAWLATGPQRRVVAIAALLLCTGLVLTTASKTSLVCLLLGVGIITALSVIRRCPPALKIVVVWLAVVMAGIGAWIWFTDAAGVLALLGKDPTLTGRTDIWQAVGKASAERPLLGYGYNAFWGEDSVPANWIRYNTGWTVPSAHHGWLDILLELGWTGAIWAGCLFGMAVLLHLARISTIGVAEGWWSLAYLAAFLLLSLSESVVMTAQNLPWVLCIAALARAFSPPATVHAPFSSPVPSGLDRFRLHPSAGRHT